MRFRHFSIDAFKATHGVKGTFAPRFSVVWSEDEAGKASFMRFIRQTLSVENLFGDTSRLPGRPLSEEERAAFGCLALRMDDGREFEIYLNVQAQEGGFRSPKGGLAGSLETSLSVTEEMKYLCLAAADGLRVFPFSDFMARMDEDERIVTDSPAEGGGNVLSGRIRDNEAEIEALRAIKRNYRESLEALEEKKNAVAWTAGQLKDERRRLRRLELVSQARPLWLEARELEKALAALSPRRAKPREGMTARLDALLEKADTLQKEADARKLKSDCEVLRRKHIENNSSLNLLPYREALENLEEETNQLKQARIEMLPLIEEARDSEKRLTSLLSDFSPRWTEKDLLEADLSLSSEERANAAREALRVAEQQAEEIARMIDAEQVSFAALEAEAASVRAEMEKIEARRLETKKQKAGNAGGTSFEERRERLLEIRHGLLRNDILFWEIRAEKMRADTLEEEIKAEENPPEPGGSYIAKFLLALFLFFSGTAAALEFLTAIIHPYGLVTALFFVLLALLPLSSIFLDRKEFKKRKQRWEAHYLRRSGMIDAIDARIDEKRRKMQAIVTSIEQKSKDLGIRMPSTVDDLDDEFDKLVNEILQDRRLEGWKDEERDVLRRMDESVRRKLRLVENLKRVKQTIETVLEDWRGWLTQNRFDASLTPEGFLSFLERMREARKELQLLETLREKLDRRKEYASTLETKIRVLSGRVGLELSRENLPAIFRSLEESLELKKQAEASSEAQKALDIERGVWEKELASVRNDIRALCEEAGVGDTAAFRVLVEECGRREVIETRLNELRRLLAGLLGAAGEDDGETCKEKTARPRKWAAYEAEFLGDALKQAEELEELRVTVAERENALERLRAAHDILERRTSSPFSDERLAELERENAALRAESQVRFRRRLTIALAKRFAEKAAERAAKEHRKVVRRARQLFPEHLFSERLPLPRDARGGQEQISLCLTLAAAYYRAERAESVPLVLDDALAHCDENRRHEIIQALWQTSGRVQIVLLTDQPDTARLLQNDLERKDGFALLSV
ncbi:MAG: hypothetical protein LBR71_06985 [Synergistaceae bacterium]|jgi:uncharacterized protein YhaN|nr:hypothetical protein [Synergistaceae bacterium]